MRIERIHATSSPLSLSTDTTTGKKLIKIPLLRNAVFQKGKYGRLVFDDPFMKKLAENFNKNVVGHDIAIDLSHKPEDGAYGWVRRVEYDGNRFVIYAEPTPEGLATVESGKYRYASADISLNHEDRETGAAFGPTLLGAALTNRPYVHGQEPISVVTLSATERARMSVRKGIARVSFETSEDGYDYRVLLAYPRSKGFKPIVPAYKKAGMGVNQRSQKQKAPRGYRPITSVSRMKRRTNTQSMTRRKFSVDTRVILASTWGGKPKFKGFSRKSGITIQGKNVKPSRADRLRSGKRVAKGVGKAALLVGGLYAYGAAKSTISQKYAARKRKKSQKLSIPIYREGDASVLILAARKSTAAKTVATKVAKKVAPKKMFPKMKRRHAGALGFAGGALAAAGAAGAGYAAVRSYNDRKRKKA